MQFFGRPTLTLILIGWHILLAASGHGLHRLTSGGHRCADAVRVTCGCSHEAPATGPSETGSVTGSERRMAADPRHRDGHDPHHCAICQFLAQHKDLPPPVGTVPTALPLAEAAQVASCAPHRSCVCPYASRAPPGTFSFA
jgi:hypothetical protein